MSRHYASSMNNKVDEIAVQAIVNLIRTRKPELEILLRQKYSNQSGIDLQYVDLRTSVRGFISSGLITT